MMPVRRCTDAELLADFLGLATDRADRRMVGERLLQRFGGLRGLLNASRRDLAEVPGAARSWARQLQAARELFRRHREEALLRGSPLTSPAETLEYLQVALRDRRREIFCCLFLDTRHRVLASEDLFQGSIDGACAFIRGWWRKRPCDTAPPL